MRQTLVVLVVWHYYCDTLAKNQNDAFEFVKTMYQIRWSFWEHSVLFILAFISKSLIMIIHLCCLVSIFLVFSAIQNLRCRRCSVFGCVCTWMSLSICASQKPCELHISKTKEGSFAQFWPEMCWLDFGVKGQGHSRQWPENGWIQYWIAGFHAVSWCTAAGTFLLSRLFLP